MASQIGHDDDVAERQGGDKELLDMGGEALAVDGVVEDAGGVNPSYRRIVRLRPRW